MIAIVDYGVGNLFSLRSSLDFLGLESRVTGDPEALRAADRIILPGVGAFGDAMDQLNRTGLVPLILEESRKKPLLGICLGMQLLLEESCEYGIHKGLGLIPGRVASLAEDLPDKTLKVPHIGWNALRIVRDDPLLKDVGAGAYMYYVHSFYATGCDESTLAVSDYGLPVTGVVRKGLVWGVQFHPEKSGDAGLRLLRAFAQLKEGV